MVDRAPTEPAQWPGELREVDADLSYAAANAAHVSEQRRSTPRQPDAAAQFDRRPNGRTRRCRAGGDTAKPRSSRRANRPDAARALLTMVLSVAVDAVDVVIMDADGVDVAKAPSA